MCVCINIYSLCSLGSRLAIVNEEVKIVLEQPQFICSNVLDSVGLSEITGPTSAGFRLEGCSLGGNLVQHNSGSSIPNFSPFPSYHPLLFSSPHLSPSALSLHLCVRVKLYDLETFGDEVT